MLLGLMLADVILRTAYQTGKAPVIQVFAMDLGVTNVLLGLIFSISTMTGIFLKPIVGWCSDRTGRWLWISIGVGIFVFVPFLYQFVDNGTELLLLRLLHGTATAVYGPVSLAIVAEINSNKKGQNFAWFGLARTVSYILGPIAGAALIANTDAVTLYRIIGCVSIASLFPIFFAYKIPRPNPETKFQSEFGLKNFLNEIIRSASCKPILLVGLMEVQGKIAVYSVKAFLPVLILINGGSVLEAGLFLSIQEFSNALSRPIVATIIDKFPIRVMVSAGLILIAFGLLLIFVSFNNFLVWIAACLIGFGHGVFSPSAQTYVAEVVKPSDFGISFGVVGSMKNIGKVSGPIIFGLLSTVLDLETVFLLIAILPLSLAILLLSTQK